jgi:hypothetical protein
MPFSILQRLEPPASFLIAGSVPDRYPIANALPNDGKSLSVRILQPNGSGNGFAK